MKGKQKSIIKYLYKGILFYEDHSGCYVYWSLRAISEGRDVVGGCCKIIDPISRMVNWTENILIKLNIQPNHSNPPIQNQRK